MVKREKEKFENIAHDSRRVGIVGIFIYRKESVFKVNEILKSFCKKIRGRMGLPMGDFNVISVIFEGTTDELGAFTGKIGRIDGVEVRSFLSKKIKLKGDKK